MKAWVLADSTNWKLYTGKKTKNTVEKGFISTSSHSRTTARLSWNTYEVYVDNFYTSLAHFTD